MNYLEKKKKAMLNYVSGITPPIPSEYQQVEYIDTNNQAITQDDLVYNNSHTFRYELDCQFNAQAISKYQGIDAGCAISATSGGYHNGSGTITISGSPLDRNLISLNATSGTTYYTIYNNGTQIGSGSRGNSSLATYSGGNGYPIGFRSRSNISASNIKVYGLKIYIDDVLERDYIPCYRKADNKVGLYDIVGNNFITTINNYEFLKGGDV